MALEGNAKFGKLQVEYLEKKHRDIFVRAILNVLSTEIAELTLAQIIDGLPLSQVAKDTYDNGGSLSDMHPLHAKHTELCSGSLQNARRFRSNFHPKILEFDSQLIHAYQAASPGSTAFGTRLVEMVAVGIHQIGMLLYKIDVGVHKDDGIASWAPPETNTAYWDLFPQGPLPTLFSHKWYSDYEQYPYGIADVVGYWAEARILGGVVLFDRRNIRPDSIYFHSDRHRVTYRIYPLLPEQRGQLVEFLVSDKATSVPLPILGDRRNGGRVDPEEAIEITGIYRDIWERKSLLRDAVETQRKDAYNNLDYPTMEDFRLAQERARSRERARNR